MTKAASALVRLEREAELRWRISLRQMNNDRIAELQRILDAA